MLSSFVVCSSLAEVILVGDQPKNNSVSIQTPFADDLLPVLGDSRAVAAGATEPRIVQKLERTEDTVDGVFGDR